MIELVGLAKRYGDRILFENLDASFPEGKTTVLFGPSGSGKTTILRLIAGFEKPDRGEIRIGKTPVSAPRFLAPPHRRGINMVFQNLALWPHLTIRGHIRFVFKAAGMLDGNHRDRMRVILSRVGLDGLEDRYPSRLSGGEQQRLAIARALAVPRPILLLDEPLAHVHAELKTDILNLIKTLKADTNLTMIYVTHHIEETEGLGDCFYRLEDGRLKKAGSDTKSSDGGVQ